MTRLLIALSALAVALPAVGSAALAQDPGDDWDVTRRGDLTLASVEFDNGGVAMRCAEEAFDVILFGLPPSEQRTRALRVSVAGGPFFDQTWTVAPNGTSAFSELPTRLARQLRAGGRLQVIAASGEQSTRRMVYDLPASPAAVDQILTACGKPLTDARDSLDPWVAPNGLPAGRQWSETPEASFPKEAQDRGVQEGYAVVSCIAGRAGRVQDCRVESEFPAGYRLGRAAVIAGHRSRLAWDRSDPDAGVGQAFVFRTTWYTTEFVPPPSRLRDDMPEMSGADGISAEGRGPR